MLLMVLGVDDTAAICQDARMVIDFWTKNSHYRADDVALTVECVGPNPFPPQPITKFGRTWDMLVVGLPVIVRWADGVGPMGKAVMRTSVIQRIERGA